MRKTIILLLFILVSNLYSDEIIAVDRTNYEFDDNATANAAPTNLKYYKYFDILPDDIVLKIFDKKDLTQYRGKHIFIGYGTIDPQGNDCRIFTTDMTGLDHNITVCLPWWRIERTYEKSAVTINDYNNILCSIPKPKPPIRVNICKKWESSTRSSVGGKVTCTSYYSRLLDKDCWDNPKQTKCFINNCSSYTEEYCTEVGAEMGDITSLNTAISNPDHTIYSTDTKVDVVTHQYECPVGKFSPYEKCLNEDSVLMYPYTCTPDNPSTAYDDGVYIYCDEDKPQYDTSGNIIGFLGQCPDGRSVICDVNSFTSTASVCTKPIEENITESKLKESLETRDYEEYSVDVLSGESDQYAADPNCIRANTVEESRDRLVYAHIIGSGYLDDDIFVLRHRPGENALKVYCNQQHNENHSSRKNYDGQILQCIDNNGNYTFDNFIGIEKNDIVSVQQATENENNYYDRYFPTGRTHHSSTKVTIDSIDVAPTTFNYNFPYYPHYSRHLRIWENSLGTLSILFPYAGAYTLYFFNRDGYLLATKTLDINDFTQIGQYDNIQLKLANDIKLATKFTDAGIENNDTKLCLDDNWAEVGGGVYGGRDSKTGATCYTPDDTYVKDNAIMKVVVKDLLTGNIVNIPLVYPLAYPNRIFISKLKLYEARKYRCYKPFSELR